MSPEEFVKHKKIVAHNAVRFTREFPHHEMLSLTELLAEYAAIKVSEYERLNVGP